MANERKSLMPIPPRAELLCEPEDLVQWFELRERRSLSQFREWMREVQLRFGQSDLTKNTARLGDGPVKVFREEVYPFRAFADQILDDVALEVSFPADNGPRDVVLYGPNDNDTQLIEIANAIDGHDDRLRMEYLSVARYVPGWGPIEKVGTRKKSGYSIKARGEARYQSQEVSKASLLVAQAVSKKLSKPYSIGTWLIVAFQDVIGFDEDDYDRIVESAKHAVKPSPISEIYLVGSGEKGFCHRVQ